VPATPFHVYFERLMNNWPTPFRAAHNFGPFAVVVEILETLQHLSASGFIILLAVSHNIMLYNILYWELCRLSSQ